MRRAIWLIVLSICLTGCEANQPVTNEEQSEPVKKTHTQQYTYVEVEKEKDSVGFTNEAAKMAQLETSLDRLMEATNPKEKPNGEN